MTSGILGPGIGTLLVALKPRRGFWSEAMKPLACWVLVEMLFVGGCATHYIPNTDVEDNDDNRKVIAFCEKYRHAVEERNVPLLLDLASPSYYEDGGNVDATDDMDYAGLREYLSLIHISEPTRQAE